MAEVPRGPVAYLKATWRLLSHENKCKVLREFEAAYWDDPKAAFGSEYQADAALFWVVHRLHGQRPWRHADEILSRLHAELMVVAKTRQPFQAARDRLGIPEDKDISTTELLAEIKRGDSRAYAAHMVRQNEAFRSFHSWAKEKGLELTPYIAAFLLLLRPWREGTVAAETARRAGSRIGFGWVVVPMLALAACLAWCVSRGEEGRGSKRSTGPSTSTQVPDSRRGPGDTPTLSGSGPVDLSGTRERVGSSVPLDVRTEPLFHLMALAQNVIIKRIPAAAPAIPRQGWQDIEKIAIVPVEHIAQWRRVDELDRRASEEAKRGDFEAALTAYWEVVAEKESASGWPLFATMPDVDYFIFTALGRRLGRHLAYEYSSPFDGPAVLGMTQYEHGRGHEVAGAYVDAIASYASCLWREQVVPESVRVERGAHFQASRWGFLLDVQGMYDDTRQRANRLVDQLVAAKRAAVKDGLVVWYDAGELRAAWITPELPDACAVGEPGPLSPPHHFGQAWQVHSEFAGTYDEQTSIVHLNGALVRRRVAPPASPHRERLVVHYSLETTSSGPCADVALAVDFCFLPDGRVAPPDECRGS